jgi:hypothetical protein
METNSNNDNKAWEAFKSFRESEKLIYDKLDVNGKFNYSTNGFIWIVILDVPNATRYKWELYAVNSSFNHSRVPAINNIDDFFDNLEYTSAKTVRTIYAKATELLIEHLENEPKSKVTIKDLGK